MKTDVVQLVFALLSVVLGGAAECLLPKVCGVGFPVLLAASVAMSARRPVRSAAVFALAAGAMEDSLSGLPTATSVAYFLLVVLGSRRIGLPPAVAALAYPVYQLWLWLWSAEVNGGVFIRLLVSVPVGFATVVAVSLLVTHLERKAAIGER